MRRKTFDVLASGVGLVLVAVLVIAGALMLWGNSYVDSNVHNQLAKQNVNPLWPFFICHLPLTGWFCCQRSSRSSLVNRTLC